jgi:hypothetical protein
VVGDFEEVVVAAEAVGAEVEEAAATAVGEVDSGGAAIAADLTAEAEAAVIGDCIHMYRFKLRSSPLDCVICNSVTLIGARTLLLYTQRVAGQRTRRWLRSRRPRTWPQRRC